MATPKRTPKTKRISVTLSAKNVSFLGALAELGVHGVTVPEVAKHFIQNEVERSIRKGLIKIDVEAK